MKIMNWVFYVLITIIAGGTVGAFGIAIISVIPLIGIDQTFLVETNPSPAQIVQMYTLLKESGITFWMPIVNGTVMILGLALPVFGALIAIHYIQKWMYGVKIATRHYKAFTFVAMIAIVFLTFIGFGGMKEMTMSHFGGDVFLGYTTSEQIYFVITSILILVGYPAVYHFPREYHYKNKSMFRG